MPNLQPSFIPVASTVSVERSSEVLITNLSMPLANNEYSHTLQNKLHELIIKAREATRLKVAFVSGDSGILYLSIEKGAVLFLNDVDFTGKTLYIQSTVAGVTVEIMELFNL